MMNVGVMNVGQSRGRRKGNTKQVYTKIEIQRIQKKYKEIQSKFSSELRGEEREGKYKTSLH